MSEAFIANGWSSVLPDGWADGSMITLVGPTGGSGFAANIVVTRDPRNGLGSVEEFAEKQKRAMQAEVGPVEILDERPMLLNGSPAFQRLHRFSMEGLTIQQVQTFVLSKEAFFVITATASVGEFNNMIAAVREFTEKFTLAERSY
jgi:hypothetical protein